MGDVSEETLKATKIAIIAASAVIVSTVFLGAVVLLLILFNFAIFYVLMVVLAGLTFGCAMWYRKRKALLKKLTEKDEDIAIRKKIEDLKKDSEI